MTNFFDTVAHTWDSNPLFLKRAEAFVKEIDSYIAGKKNLTGLEFGAGTGLLSVELRNYFTEIVMIDSSKEMLVVADKKLKEANIQHITPLFLDLEHSDYTEKTFDVIYSQMVMHHVDDVEQIIAKLYKMLNANGLLAIADLYEEDGKFHDHDFNGHFGFNTDALTDIVSKQGFTHINFKHYFDIPRMQDGNTKLYPVFFMTAVK